MDEVDFEVKGSKMQRGGSRGEASLLAGFGAAGLLGGALGGDDE